VQVLLTVAANGLEGIVRIGLVPVVVAFLVFFYLTRPHVAAAFGRHGRFQGAELDPRRSR
jgi:hypothetical protein